MYNSERFYVSEDERMKEERDYEMAVAYKRLKFKMGRQCIAERKLRLRKMIAIKSKDKL